MGKKKKKLRKLRVLILLIIILLIGGGSVYFYYMYSEVQSAEHISQSIREQIDALFQDSNHVRFKDDISEDEILNIEEAISKLKDSEEKTQFTKEFDNISTCFNAYHSVRSLLQEHIIIEGVTQEDLDKMQDLVAKAGALNQAFLKTLEADVLNVMQQFQKIQQAREKVDGLFMEDQTTLRDDITLQDLEVAQNYIKDIKNEKEAAILTSRVQNAEEEIQARIDADKQMQQAAEKAAEEAAAAAEAARKSYVVLDVPYISQTANGAPQGCESASLLMALRYKGAATTISYTDFIDQVPVADDPNYGFVHSQYSNDPTGVPHTIFPAPLAEYGQQYGNVVNISGASAQQLRSELLNGNPIVLYIVSGFQEPIWIETSYGMDILNMHVLTLIGYNDNLQKYLVNDPYYGVFWVDYAVLEASYQTRNYALVVR